PAREVRVSVAPDFRLHYSSGFGCLYFVSWDRLNGYAQTHQKPPFKLQVCITQTGCNSLKRFGGEFEGNLSSEKVPLKKNSI
ncbi:MAG: hypothetical protein IJP32_05425, partial [Clostridia bacterium]|nr:hypothetical protein [Clostridia bacterium]